MTRRPPRFLILVATLAAAAAAAFLAHVARAVEPADVLSVRVDLKDGRDQLVDLPLDPVRRATIAAWLTSPSSPPPGPPADPPPVVTPPAPPGSPVAHRRRIIGPAGTRENGVNLTAGQAELRDVYLSGWDHNIVAMNLPAARLTNVVSVGAFRLQGKRFGGQDLYTESVKTVDIASCLFGYAGWSPDKPREKTVYRHGYYGNHGSVAHVTDSIFYLAANCGAQLRDDATFERCVFIDCGHGYFNGMGRSKLIDCLILGGTYYGVPDDQGNFTAWEGMNGIGAFWPIDCHGVAVVALAGQFQGGTFVAKNPKKLFPGSALWASTIPASIRNDPKKPWWKAPPTDQLFTGSGNVIRGWPQSWDAGNGKTRPGIWGGDLGDKQDKSVFRVLPGGPITYDYMPTIQSVIDEKISAADASRKIREDVARLIGGNHENRISRNRPDRRRRRLSSRPDRGRRRALSVGRRMLRSSDRRRDSREHLRQRRQADLYRRRPGIPRLRQRRPGPDAGAEGPPWPHRRHLVAADHDRRRRAGRPERAGAAGVPAGADAASG